MMLAFLTLILPFIWHYGLGAILLGAAVVLYMLTAFKKVAIAIGAGAVIALVAYSIGIVNGTDFVQAKFDAYKVAQEEARLAEVARIEQANAESKAEEAKYIAWLLASKLSLEQQIEENSNAAVLDPNAGRISLGSDSVLRLNKIRR